MSVTIEPVTAANFQAVTELEIAENQRAYIHPPTVTALLAEVRLHPTYAPYALYTGETPVGFAIYGHDGDPEKRWIAVLMIDRRHQGKGYGRAAVQAIIQRIRQDAPGCREIGLSYKPDNLAAERHYLSLGFVKTGEPREDGDTVVRLRMSDDNHAAGYYP